MAAKNFNLTGFNKRKLLFILRILVLTFAVFYLIFFLYNHYFVDDQIELYFSNNNASFLKIERRLKSEQKDIYFQLFEELKAGPKSEKLNQTIPGGSKLLDYELKGELIILNFNDLLQQNHWGGSTGELMTVYSIVNTYSSLAEINSVKIIIEGREVDTLAGHLDLSQPLRYNKSLTE